MMALARVAERVKFAAGVRSHRVAAVVATELIVFTHHPQRESITSKYCMWP